MNHHLCLHAEINAGIRIVNMYLHANHRTSLRVISGNLIDLGYFPFIFLVRNRNIRLLSHRNLCQVILCDGNIHLYLLIAFYGEQLGSFRNRGAFQKSSSCGGVCRRRHCGNLGHNSAKFRFDSFLSFCQLLRRLLSGDPRALHVVGLLLLRVRIHNSRLRRGFLSFPPADFLFHIIQLFLFRINNALLFLHLIGHTQIVNLIRCAADALIQVLDGLLNPLSAFFTSGL